MHILENQTTTTRVLKAFHVFLLYGKEMCIFSMCQVIECYVFKYCRSHLKLIC